MTYGLFLKLEITSCKALLDTMLQMRSEGYQTPYVVFWTRCSSDTANADYVGVINATYSEFYQSGIYSDLFVYWNSKPFMLTTDLIPSGVSDEFSLRLMGGLQNPLKTEEWSFLQPYPQQIAKASDGSNEQASVCTAIQETYMTEPTAVGRRGGNTFFNEWTVAFNSRPKVLTICWWNEWAAQRFIDVNGNSVFCDNYTQEFSRDIEPMTGGHGDKYYRWMCQYISAYKNHQVCPKLTDW